MIAFLTKAKPSKFLYTLIFLQLLFWLYKIVTDNYLILVDSIEYFNLAKNILSSFDFYSGDLSAERSPELYTKRPPFYSIFIIICSGFLTSKASLLFIQGVLSIINILIIKSIFESYFNKAKRWLLIVFLASSFNQFIYSNLIMSEILLQTLIVLSIYFLHQLLKGKSSNYLIFYQVSIALLFLTKPVFFLFVIPNLIITFLISKRINFNKGTLYAIIPIIVLVLYSHWNYLRTGSYNFSSIQQINLVNYNLKYFHVSKYGDSYALEINKNLKLGGDTKKTYAEKLFYLNSSALDYMKKDFLSYCVFHTKGIIRLFIDPGRFDLSHFLGFEVNATYKVGLLKHLNENGIKGAFVYLKSQPLVIVLCFNLLLLFNLIKFSGFIWFLFKLIRHSNITFWIMLSVIFYVAALTGPLGASRFLVPFLPMYLFFSVYGFSDLLNKINHRLKNFSNKITT